VTNNNKQTVVDAAELAFKLYPFSSDSVRNAFITGYNKAKEMECVLLCAKEQRSIELPSDEEIKEMRKAYLEEVNDIVHADLERDGYLDLGFHVGAKWMRDKIQGGIK
jgi:hypothetical protein